MACLEIRELVVSPGKGFKTAPIDLSVERGEILCLVGPSGCGKTTLIRAVAGLITPLQGKIFLEGLTLNDPKILVGPNKRKIGMVFQNLALWPHMTALDHVLFAAPPGKERKTKSKALLASLGLSSKERVRPGKLSGGEGQRLALARALIGDPALILLDEPLRSVDPHLRAEIGSMLRQLVKERETACVMVTHDRDEALSLGDSIAVMQNGKILCCAAAQELLSNPPDPFTASFLKGGSINAALSMEDENVVFSTEEGPGLGEGGEKNSTSFTLRLSILAVLAVILFTGLALFSGKSQGEVLPPSFSSSKECKACHAQVYEEWLSSWHAKAWTDPEVRNLSNNFQNKTCLSCHASRPVVETGLDQRVLPRTTRLMDGIDCLSCHMDARGRVIGMRDVSTARCRPIKHEEAFGKNKLCAPCHNQHFTHDQWKASNFGKEKKWCKECHMPEIVRRLPDGTTRRGRSHVFMASHHPAFVAKAPEMKVERLEKGIRITVINKGAGHNFPTDSRHRAADLSVSFKEAGKWSQWKKVARFRQPYRSEPGPNTQLVSGESRCFNIEKPEKATTVRIRLDYRHTPYVKYEPSMTWQEMEKTGMHLDSKRALVLKMEELSLK